MGESSDRQLRGDAQTQEDKAVPHWAGIATPASAQLLARE